MWNLSPATSIPSLLQLLVVRSTVWINRFIVDTPSLVDYGQTLNAISQRFTVSDGKILAKQWGQLHLQEGLVSHTMSVSDGMRLFRLSNYSANNGLRDRLSKTSVQVPLFQGWYSSSNDWIIMRRRIVCTNNNVWSATQPRRSRTAPYLQCNWRRDSSGYRKFLCLTACMHLVLLGGFQVDVSTSMQYSMQWPDD